MIKKGRHQLVWIFLKKFDVPKVPSAHQDCFTKFEAAYENVRFKFYASQTFDKSLDESKYKKNPLTNFWLRILEMIEILLPNIDNIQTQNWERFKFSLKLMLQWMVTYDNSYYGRWLPFFWKDISNLSKQYANHITEIFAESISGTKI